ncbi:MAG TPA: hypothetical protein IAB21_00950 [Candidatus Avelusimicrobium excrementipullorum]|nr:hypothetical protein [Candidatus Avelusimicrobium excrementipullorum]
MAEPFIPTLKWHIKVLAVLLVLCTAAFFIVSYAMTKLPAPYRPHKPAPETTPWLD